MLLRNMAGIYIRSGEKMLLLYRVGSRVVEPSWCNIGGHFEKDELNDPESCVLRELFEETGITKDDIGNLKLKYITLRLINNEIRQNYYFFADLVHSGIPLGECDEGTLEWADIDTIMEREMPFTAKKCLEHYLSSGKSDDVIYAGIVREDTVLFTPLDMP